MPRYGFNFLWIFSTGGKPNRQPEPPAVRELDFVAEAGLDFVRVPADYRFWTHDFDYFHPDGRAIESVDRYLEACRSRGLHMCLNLHRAPGYCIDAADRERHNLWTDQVAQDGFVANWENFARIYKGVPARWLSFDLLNEPPAEGNAGFTRAVHEKIMRRAVAAIRAIDPQREIVLDGIGAGHQAIPELADLGAIHSCRGYQPFTLTHYQAPWAKGTMELPLPTWPDHDQRGVKWTRESLKAFYAPWRDVEKQGVTAHVGEFGCYNRTPNDVALRWFEDLLGLFREFGWGYALWNFRGSFGVVEHGRPGAVYENRDGFKVDARLLELLLANRVKDRPAAQAPPPGAVPAMAARTQVAKPPAKPAATPAATGAAQARVSEPPPGVPALPKRSGTRVLGWSGETVAK